MNICEKFNSWCSEYFSIPTNNTTHLPTNEVKVKTVLKIAGFPISLVILAAYGFSKAVVTPLNEKFGKPATRVTFGPVDDPEVNKFTRDIFEQHIKGTLGQQPAVALPLPAAQPQPVASAPVAVAKVQGNSFADQIAAEAKKAATAATLTSSVSSRYLPDWMI